MTCRVTPSSDNSTTNIVPPTHTLNLPSESNIDALLAPGELYARYSEGQAVVSQERGLRIEA